MHFPQACLFDLDGVLLDTEGLHSEAWLRTAAIFGTKLSEDQLLKLKGQRRIDCAKQIVKWTKKELNNEDILKVHQPISHTLMNRVKGIPGAEDLIRWCSLNNLPMALVTSSSSSSVDRKSESNVWLKLIKTRVYGDDSELERGKPAPDPYLLAASKLMANPQSCWALEDSSSGTKSALLAGCQVWVLDPLNKVSPKNHTKNNMSNLYRINHLNQFLLELKQCNRDI